MSVEVTKETFNLYSPVLQNFNFVIIENVI